MEHGRVYERGLSDHVRMWRVADAAVVNSPYVPALAKVIAQVSVECQKECEKFPDGAECKACGDFCKSCAEECRKIYA